MDSILRPVTGGGTWRPSLRPLSGGTGGRVEAMGGRWAAWAARLLDRYGEGNPTWDRLGTVLHRAGPTPAPGPGQTVVVHAPGRSVAWPINLTLHLTIPAARQAMAPPPTGAPTLATPAATVRVEAAGAPLQPATVLRQVVTPAMQVVETSLARLHRREVWTNTHETELVTRLLTRQTRQESAGVPGDWSTAAPPPARVLNHPSVAPQAAPAPPVPPTTAPPGLRYWDEAAAPPAPPAVDIGHLTDQVMRTMEDRVIAARERLGKR